MELTKSKVQSGLYVFRECDCKNEFIQLYSDSYYMDKGSVGQIAPNASGTRKFIENRIDDILTNGVSRKLDVIHILAWKMSKFVQSESKEKFVYAEDWKALQDLCEDDIAEELCVERYGNSFEIGKIAVSLMNALPKLDQAAQDSWRVLLKELNSTLGSFYGLGPVYLITLMYFISRGNYPIYDQFAMMALRAIEAGKMPGSNVEYKGLQSVVDLIDNDDPIFGYQHYIDLLNLFFKDELLKNGKPCRDVDRALWVYGHYFKAIPPKKKNA